MSAKQAGPSRFYALPTDLTNFSKPLEPTHPSQTSSYSLLHIYKCLMSVFTYDVDMLCRDVIKLELVAYERGRKESFDRTTVFSKPLEPTHPSQTSSYSLLHIYKCLMSVFTYDVDMLCRDVIKLELVAYERGRKESFDRTTVHIKDITFA